MTKGDVPSSKPSDVQQDSKEQFKTTGTSFQPKLNPFKSKFKCMQTGVSNSNSNSNLTNMLWKTK